MKIDSYNIEGVHGDGQLLLSAEFESEELGLKIIAGMTYIRDNLLTLCKHLDALVKICVWAGGGRARAVIK